jgi:hypothetical protein
MRTLAALLCLLALCYGTTLHPVYAQQLPPPSSYHPFQLSHSLDGEDYRLTGNATQGINVKSFALTPNASMEVRLDPASKEAGEIVLLLPNSMINNITSVKAMVSGVSQDAQIMQAFANSTHFALQVAVPPGAQSVVINAAHVAPEFQFTALLAALSLAAITAVLALWRKSK